jgi:hypothetical protein
MRGPAEQGLPRLLMGVVQRDVEEYLGELSADVAYPCPDLVGGCLLLVGAVVALD